MEVSSGRSHFLFLLFSAGLLLFGHPEVAKADLYPAQLSGAWGGRAAFAGDDNPQVAAATCESYSKNPKAVTGDLLVFQGTQKSSFGGYADYVDKNVSVKLLKEGQWEITDRHYQDEEGGAKPGYKNVTYKVTISGEIISVTEGTTTVRYSKCAPKPAVQQTPPPKISFLKGECKVELGGIDLGCLGPAVHTQLDNGRNLINFPTRDVATIGYSGSSIVRAGDTNSTLWVDRVYVNQSVQNADGQCSLDRGTELKPASLECRAVLRDGRKIVAELKTQDSTQSFLVSPTPVTTQSPPVSNSNCPAIIKTHGFLSRAQFQCGFRYYSNDMLQSAKSCTQSLPAADAKELISSGMMSFDQNEAGRGRARLCADVLKNFPNIVRK